MLRFKAYLEESKNKFRTQVEKPLSQGKEVGVVSPERGGLNKKGKKEVHAKMKGDLQRLRKSGAISGFHSADGRYQYDDPKPGESGIAKEKSYVVKQGEGRKAKHFDRIVHALGNRYGQESTMKIKKDKSAEYHQLNASPRKGEVDDKGKVVYNRKLVKGSGDTSFRGKHPFTTTKE